MRIALIGLIAVLLVGCIATGTPSPTATSETVATIRPTSEPSASLVPPSPSVTAMPEPSRTPFAAVPTPEPPVLIAIGDRTLTLTDELRMRSKPWVGEDSTKYAPTLPKGTGVTILDGPVFGSGYWWYRVRLESGTLNDGIRDGWVASADHDGTEWLDAGGCDVGPLAPDATLAPGEMPC